MPQLVGDDTYEGCFRKKEAEKPLGHQMNDSKRLGVDVRVALAMRLTQSPSVSEPQQPEAPLAEKAPPLATGFRTKIKKRLRPLASAFFRLIKPFVRPIAFRAREYFASSFRQELVKLFPSEIDANHRILLQALASNETALQQIKIDLETIDARFSPTLQSMIRMQSKLNALGDSTMQIRAKLLRVEEYSFVSARRSAIPCGPDAVMIRTTVGYLLCQSSDYALIAALIESGELEPGTRTLVQKLLRPGDTFVDAGANVGLLTLAAASSIGRQGKVIAFEPFPATAELLRKSVWINGFAEIVTVHQAAVSSRHGTLPLHLGITSGHHSLFPLKESSRIADARHIEVPLVGIDEALGQTGKVTLLKIDVEGAELEVLESAIGTIKANPDIALIVEYGGSHLLRTGQTVESWLAPFHALGFDFRAIDPNTGQLQILCVEELSDIDTINLFFARPQSPAWERGV